MMIQIIYETYLTFLILILVY